MQRLRPAYLLLNSFPGFSLFFSFSFPFLCFLGLFGCPKLLPDIRPVHQGCQSSLFLFFDGKQRIFPDFRRRVSRRVGILKSYEFSASCSNLIYILALLNVEQMFTYILVTLSQHFINSLFPQQVFLHLSLTNSSSTKGSTLCAWSSIHPIELLNPLLAS